MATTTASQSSSRLGEMPTSHPMDSSRLFMALMSFVQGGDSGQSGEQSIISVTILRRLLSAIHFRDANTLKHSRRVGLISVGIASRLGWEADDLRIIEIAALLHDVGKVGVPDHILRKPGKLSPDEAEYIAVHHRVALTLLQACQIHPDVVNIISQSHGIDAEPVTGRAALSLGSRILAVADAYDSLTTRQCYRAPYDRWEALQILEEQSGKQFDRNVVAALGRWLDGPDAAGLADERAAEVSIQVNAPVDVETRAGAGQLCLVFNHLYLLESLYDAFYVVDANRKVAIWSSGAAQMFQRTPAETLQRKWSRQLVTKQTSNSDPLETVFMTGQPLCHGMTIQDANETYLDVDVQSIPIQSDESGVTGVVELICNSKESKRHRGQFRSLQMAATRDPLTGVLNRGELERRLEEAYESWTADPKAVFSVVFMDLDHFKSINDRISHSVGDRVLIDVARLLQDDLYSGEVVGRYGGEEFVILCPETDLDAAVEKSERLRRAIMSTRFADRDDLRVTGSFGVAQIQQNDTMDSVVDRADKALYDAKNQGRNRTCMKRVEVVAASKERTPSRPQWSHQATIVTRVASDMLALKLSGFIEEQAAKIEKVSSEQVTLKLGSAGLFGGWSKNLERCPVKLTLDLSPPNTENQSNSSVRLVVKATVTPIGKPTDEELFRTRASIIVEQLRSHLIAD